ncbi:hypothetical protein BDY24DRAFT_411578 [Mrakia frigida]|uniref:GPI anchored serine-threonine rich family protein n=1 Tax=Mrakia frigida TaxID=29902 RepID=UPI003FCC175D
MLASLISTVTLAAIGASAIQVTYPSKRDTWTSSGAQTVEWDWVSTDATSFAMVLVNQDSSFLADTTSLNENVTTSTGSTTVTFPDGDFPVGTSFQVNFIRDADRDDSILAQSAMFNITQSDVVATTATTATTAATSATSATRATSATSAIAPLTLSGSASASAAAASASADASGGTTTNIPAGNSGASALTSSSALLLAVVGVVGAALL